jgi:hypothetical protein
MTIPKFSHNMKKYLIWSLIVLLLLLHQDNWFWNDATLVFGFLPVGLLYHAGISLAAAITWFLAVQFIWPEKLEPAATDSTEVQSGSESAP